MESKISIIERVLTIVLIMATMTAGGVLYQFMKDVPDYASALSRGWFQSVGILVAYFAFKIIGWIRD